MTKIEAYLRPNKLEDVKRALGQYGIHGMTAIEVIGCGLQKGYTEVINGEEYDLNLLPKTKIEVIVHDGQVDDVVEIIAQNAHTGRIGDGKIFTYPVNTAMRIRTGEKGETVV